MLKIRQYVEHDFVLLLDGDYEDENIKNLAERLEYEFEVATLIDKDEKPNDFFDRGSHAIKFRATYHTFERVRKYMYALGYDDEFGYLCLVKHDREDFYCVM